MESISQLLQELIVTIVLLYIGSIHHQVDRQSKSSIKNHGFGYQLVIFKHGFHYPGKEMDLAFCMLPLSGSVVDPFGQGRTVVLTSACGITNTTSPKTSFATALAPFVGLCSARLALEWIHPLSDIHLDPSRVSEDFI